MQDELIRIMRASLEDPELKSTLPANWRAFKFNLGPLSKLSTLIAHFAGSLVERVEPMQAVVPRPLPPYLILRLSDGALIDCCSKGVLDEEKTILNDNDVPYIVLNWDVTDGRYYVG